MNIKCCIYFGLVALAACRGQPATPEAYFFQINNVYLRIPEKYGPLPPPVSRNAPGDCRQEYDECVSRPPGARTEGMLFIEQDFHSFERYKETTGFQGMSDMVGFSINIPDSRRHRLPNFSTAWNVENRDPKNDIYGLQTYKKISRDDVNYRFDLKDGTTLLMTCKNFNMPNPGCEAITTWHGLQLSYHFRHRHLFEWQSLHQRLVKHLDSFLYQP